MRIPNPLWKLLHVSILKNISILLTSISFCLAFNGSTCGCAGLSGAPRFATKSVHASKFLSLHYRPPPFRSRLLFARPENQLQSWRGRVPSFLPSLTPNLELLLFQYRRMWMLCSSAVRRGLARLRADIRRLLKWMGFTGLRGTYISSTKFNALSVGVFMILAVLLELNYCSSLSPALPWLIAVK